MSVGSVVRRMLLTADASRVFPRRTRRRAPGITRRVRQITFTRNAALVDGEIVGFVGSGPARDKDAPAFRELYFIYLLDAWHSTGIGQKLFDAAVEKDEPLYLWVVEDNPRAHRFYARNGFRLDGASHTEPFLGETLTEVRFVRP